MIRATDVCPSVPTVRNNMATREVWCEQAMLGAALYGEPNTGIHGTPTACRIVQDRESVVCSIAYPQTDAVERLCEFV
jgi:hypothetical protein